VLVALVGFALLHEEISATRWAGIVLIMGGVALVSFGTAPQTPRPKARATGAGQ
jgi:drug/metabolite transporter (DMT)-like permease